MQTSTTAPMSSRDDTKQSTIVSARDVRKSFLVGDVIVQALRGITI